VAVQPNSPAPSSGLAIAALVVGILAFLTGLAPIWGIIAGGAAVALGAIALAKKQSKGLALTGLILGGVAMLASLVTTVALVAGLANVREHDAALPPTTVAPSSAPTATTSKPVAETVSQANARRKAQSYLDYSPFSRKGLIGQLKYEGFSTADARYGADAVDANWKKQAAGKAKEYLEFTSFSRRGLIDQLVFDGFTLQEARFGADSVGL
jgi:hypothetical protein